MTPIWVEIDVTPWVTHPFSGIGRTSKCSLDALSQLKCGDFTFCGVSRVGPFPKISHLNLNRHNRIYHGFEHKLPLMLGMTRILTVHDLWTLDPNPYQSPSFQKRQSKRLEKAIRSANTIVTPSETVKNQLLNRFQFLEGRVSAIHHGWQLELEGPQSPLSPSLSRFLMSSDPFIFTIAILEHRKNIMTLLEALKRIEVRLVIVGSPGYRYEEIFNTLSNHPKRDQIFYLPHATDIELRALMMQASVYVQPSLDEGFGMPVIDAMHFNKRLVLSDIPTFQEIAGTHATYFDPKSAENLSHTIEYAMQQPPPNPQEVGVRLKDFTWNTVAVELLRTYRIALERVSSTNMKWNGLNFSEFFTPKHSDP